LRGVALSTAPRVPLLGGIASAEAAIISERHRKETMTDVLDWGIKVVLWWQQLSPTLDGLFRFLTFLGGHTFSVLLITFVYWCVERRTGARLLVLFLFSGYLNTVAKALGGQPRPFDYDSRVKKLTPAGGFGLPSGHTQNTAVVWGYLALSFKNPFVWVFAGLLTILVPLSRVYLGVHFPTDLLGGYALAAVLLTGFHKYSAALESWMSRQRLMRQVGLALGIPVLLIVVNPGKTYAAVAAGALMGVATGIVLERRFVRFSAAGPWWKRGVRYGIGVSLLIGLWFGLRSLLASLEPRVLFHALRYLLIGLWAVWGAPFVFVRLGLAAADSC
jgi:membrane-associated phospholipid phosphatase